MKYIVEWSFVRKLRMLENMLRILVWEVFWLWLKLLVFMRFVDSGGIISMVLVFWRIDNF